MAAPSPLYASIQALSVGCCVGMALAMLPAAYQGDHVHHNRLYALC